MQVDKIKRGESFSSGKKFTWVNEIILWCDSCQETKIFKRAGHSMSKNLIIVCSKCGDQIKLTREEVKDTVESVAVTTGSGQPYSEEDDEYEIFPWEIFG